MSRETLLNLAVLATLLAVALFAHLSGEPYLVTLATKAVILGMAGTGLNLALGYGGLVSFGHAAFFGIGGYAAGILASAAQNYEPLMTWPLELPGTTSMPVASPRRSWRARTEPRTTGCTISRCEGLKASARCTGP